MEVAGSDYGKGIQIYMVVLFSDGALNDLQVHNSKFRTSAISQQITIAKTCVFLERR